MATTAPHHYYFGVVMSCGGCSGAVDRNLKKIQETGAVTEYDVKLQPENPEKVGDVNVHTKPETGYKEVLEAIVRTRKTVKGAAEVVDGQKVPFESWEEDVKEILGKLEGEKAAAKAAKAAA